MGNCMQSKDSHKKKKVKINIKWTGVYDVDELFRAAVAPLQTLDDISKSLRKKSKNFKKSTFSHVIVNWTLTDSIYAMLYIFAANQERIVENLKLKIVTHSPFIKVKKSKLPHDVVKIYEDFKELVEVLISIPDQLIDLNPQIHHLVEEAKEFPDRANDIIKNISLGPMELVKANKRIMKNVQKISSSKAVLEGTSATINAFTKALESFANTFESTLSTVEDLGKKARNDGILHPKELIPKYWPEQTRIDLKLNVPPKPKGHKK